MSNTAHDIWNKASEHLSGLLHPDTYSRWIAVIEPCTFNDNVLTLAVGNDFYQTWLEENYVPLIQNAVASVTGSQVKIVLTVKPREAQEVPPQTEEEKKAPVIREKSSKKKAEPQLKPEYTFENFVIGSSNNFAHAAAQAVAQAPARAYNPLFIYGGTGLGKTHLIQAIGHHVLAASSMSVCYVSSETMMNDYIEAIQKKTQVQFRKKYRSVNLLLIDDIHFLAGKEGLQEEFFHTFNALYDMRKQIVMTSDRPIKEIMGLQQRLVSRFEWGLVTELEPPDLETRIAILREKIELMKASLSDEIVNFVAMNIKSNVRKLEGALTRIISYASMTGRELTIQSVEYLLSDMIEKEKLQDITFDSIQRAVAEHYDVRLADMSSKKRSRNVAGPRQVAMYLCRRFTSSSLPDIANAFGKTHATILHAGRTIESRMDVDPRLRQDVNQIAQKLGKPLI